MISLIGTVVGIWIDGFKKSFDYSGRATRFEYNMFMLVYAVFAGIALFVLVQMDIGAKYNHRAMHDFIPIETYVLAVIMSILYIPAISMSVRRIRDAGYPAKTGWLYFIPIFGWIYIFKIMNKPSTNRDVN